MNRIPKETSEEFLLAYEVDRIAVSGWFYMRRFYKSSLIRGHSSNSRATESVGSEVCTNPGFDLGFPTTSICDPAVPAL